jgi:hypothetical protein
MSNEELSRTKNNSRLSLAKKAKFDEFYTQYHDIEKEMNAYLDFDKAVFQDKTILLPCDDPEWSNFTKYFAQNFERLGLKKLISTSYAPDSKPQELNLQLTLFETQSPKFDKSKARANGKIYTLTRDTSGDKKINVEDLEWAYLKGDGDFRSPEVTALRDEADIIITNPPFSLFREFLEWIVAPGKKFVVLGNKNAVINKYQFPLIKNNQMWLGSTPMSTDLLFHLPKSVEARLVAEGPEGSAWKRVDGQILGRSTSVWYSNLDHGRRHEYLPLMTMADNLKFSKHKVIQQAGYRKYDNFDAIDVPFTDAIPSDYLGAMGVPISFLSKHNPDQFEIVWQASGNTRASAPSEALAELKYQPHPDDRGGCGVINGERVYSRILIRHRRAA